MHVRAVQRSWMAPYLMLAALTALIAIGLLGMHALSIDHRNSAAADVGVSASMSTDNGPDTAARAPDPGATGTDTMNVAGACIALLIPLILLARHSRTASHLRAHGTSRRRNASIRAPAQLFVPRLDRVEIAVCRT